MKRTDLLKWSQAAGMLSVVSRADRQSAIRMRDIPDISTLERRLLLLGPDHPEVSDQIDAVRHRLFGLWPAELRFDMPAIYWDLADFDPKRIRLDAAFSEYEDQFDTGDDLTDDETVEVLFGYGLDFMDDRGQPLRCTKHFGRAAELASKGLKGRLPDRSAMQAEQFENALVRERDAFLAKKRSR